MNESILSSNFSLSSPLVVDKPQQRVKYVTSGIRACSDSMANKRHGKGPAIPPGDPPNPGISLNPANNDGGVIVKVLEESWSLPELRKSHKKLATKVDSLVEMVTTLSSQLQSFLSKQAESETQSREDHISDDEDQRQTPQSDDASETQPTPIADIDAKLKSLKHKYASPSSPAVVPHNAVKLYLHIGGNTHNAKWIVSNKLFTSYSFVKSTNPDGDSDDNDYEGSEAAKGQWILKVDGKVRARVSTDMQLKMFADQRCIDFVSKGVWALRFYTDEQYRRFLTEFQDRLFENVYGLKSTEENKVKIYGKEFLGWVKPEAADDSAWDYADDYDMAKNQVMWRSCGLKASNVFKDLVKKGGGKFRGQNPCGVLGLSNCGWSFERRDGFAAAIGGGDGESEKVSRGVLGGGGLPISFGEAKRLMRLVNVEALKARLGTEGKEAIPYDDLIEACQSIGVARSKEVAAAFARVLDEAGVILLFRDKVLLHPDRVVDLVRKAVPLALTPDNDPMWEELRKIQENKIAIDTLAHKMFDVYFGEAWA